MPAIETQHLAGEMDFKTINDRGEFSGYLSTFGNVDLGGDIVEKGAFDVSLDKYRASGRKPKMLWQHNPTQPIGVWDDLKVDDRGLFGTGRLLTDTEKGREAYVLAKAGAIEGISIGYRTIDADLNANGTRSLKEVDLLEASVVTFPMNTEATITQIKSLQTIRDVERVLRDAGVPNVMAKLVATHGFETASQILKDQQRDAEVKEALDAEAESFREIIRQMKEKLNA